MGFSECPSLDPPADADPEEGAIHPRLGSAGHPWQGSCEAGERDLALFGILVAGNVRSVTYVRTCDDRPSSDC